MKRLRLLYVDVPFEHESGGDKNRSRFLWQTLAGAFDAECLLIAGGAPPDGKPWFTRIPTVLTLAPVSSAWSESESVHRFAPDALAAFDRLLQERRYDVVFTRFHSPWHLAGAAARHPLRPAVAVDLDMVSSRLVGLTWRQAPSWKNRWFLFERLKLERLERRLVRAPFLVFLSNPVELADLRDRVAPASTPTLFAPLPNVMPAPGPLPPVAPQPPILFFGSLNSGANTDAFRFLVQDLLPLLEPDLHRHQVRIHVAGKHPPAWFADLLAKSGTDRVVLVGGVDSMERALAESRFALLPLRVASGTRTRILEAAAAGRTVVTTPLGAEGIETGDGALIADTPGTLAAAVRRLLDDPSLAAQLGAQLRATCLARYAADRVGADLVRDLESFVAARKEPSA